MAIEKAGPTDTQPIHLSVNDLRLRPKALPDSTSAHKAMSEQILNRPLLTDELAKAVQVIDLHGKGRVGEIVDLLGPLPLDESRLNQAEPSFDAVVIASSAAGAFISALPASEERLKRLGQEKLERLMELEERVRKVEPAQEATGGLIDEVI